ncbi:hypothetical protein D3C73_1015930 [compost metagenome]
MHAHGGAVLHGAADGDLELARQEGEFGMQRGPLADDFAPDQRIDQLIGRDAGEVVGGGVADAVAAGLNGVHLDGGEFRQDVRHVFQAGPVELDVLAGAEVAVAAIPFAGDVRQRAQLARRQHAVRNGHAQHGRVALDVQAVLQAQNAEFIFGKLAVEEAARLIGKLRHSLLDKLLVDGVIHVHVYCPCGLLGLSPSAPGAGRRKRGFITVTGSRYQRLSHSRNKEIRQRSAGAARFNHRRDGDWLSPGHRSPKARRMGEARQGQGKNPTADRAQPIKRR